MNLHDLRLLLDFHYWARDRTLDAVDALTRDQWMRDMGSSFRSVRDTLLHLYLAEWVWYSRWQGDSPTTWPSTDALVDVAALRTVWIDHEAKVRAFVDNLGEDGVRRVYEYTLMNGQAGRSPLGQMLQHLVNHGTYHRGQVSTMLRQLGAAPPKSVDLITFFRERA